MEPLVALASTTQLYESSVSLSTPQGHSITGYPIIVKLKSVPAPFTLQGSPQQDWGSGSLPPRNLIIWSGWQDLNLRCLASEARGVTGLSYTQNHGAGHENCTRTNWLEASDAAVEH